MIITNKRKCIHLCIVYNNNKEDTVSQCIQIDNMHTHIHVIRFNNSNKKNNVIHNINMYI